MKLTHIVFTLLATAAIWAQSGNDLFQQALIKERSQGDVAGAIQLYERIVKEHSADRRLASRALLQIAQCQERQGGENARRTYERLVKDFADQPQAVSEARARISALSAPATASAAPRVRQLWKGPEVDIEGSISPDGRWFSYAHWDTGDLGLRDLQNGTNRLLTNTGGWEKSGGQFAQDSVFSPDGKQIAYNWFAKEGYEVRIMNADGSGVRTLAFKDVPGYAVPRAWSADGRTLAVAQFDRDGLTSLHLVTVATGELRRLIAPRKETMWGVSFSPDGRWLAFDSGGWFNGSDIYAIPVSGGEPVALVVNAAMDSLPVWSADGRSLFFTSNREGSYGLYRIPVEDGRVAGNASLVKGDLGMAIDPIGFSRAGSFHYGLQVQGIGIYEMDYDSVTRKTGKPVLVSEGIPGRNSMPAYSPDGKYLTWAASTARERSSQAVVRELATGRERTFPSPTGILSVTWSPDSRKLLFQVRTQEPNTSSLDLLDLSTGQYSVLHSVSPSRNALSPVFSADGSKIYMIWREWPKKDWQVIALDPVTKQVTGLFKCEAGSEYGHIHSLTLSPDGRTLAFVRRLKDFRHFQLLLLPVMGGEPRVVTEYESLDDNRSRAISFAPDGKSILVRQGREKKETGARNPAGLLTIDLATGQSKPLDFEGVRIQSPTIHPSGRKIAFQAGQGEVELWVAENILPPAK